MIFSRYVPGDIVAGYKFAWLPTKVTCQKTGKGYTVWFRDYYLWKQMFKGNLSEYWVERKYLNYDPDRFDKMMKKKGLR